MAWHYRDCDLGHGAWQAKQLHVSLLQLSKRLPISVYAGDKVLEIIPQALNVQVSNFLEIVVLRFRRLLKSKPAGAGTTFQLNCENVEVRQLNTVGRAGPLYILIC